jgi:hypothetical protein
MEGIPAEALEAAVRSTGTYVFGGALYGPDIATVVRVSGGDVLTTDGPFAESKETSRRCKSNVTVL